MGFGYYLLCLIPPLLVAFISHTVYTKTISRNETLMQIGVVVFSSLLLLAISYPSPISVNEIINGQVISKTKERVSCEHDYQCNPHSVSHTTTDSNGKISTYTTIEYDTCYEHRNDYDWTVTSSIDSFWSGSVVIDRIDEQGTQEPPRWSQVRIGDPYSIKHSYVDYIKSAPDSLFNKSETEFIQFKDMIPEYPENIYDYYRIDRVLSVGVSIPDIKQWNSYLSQKLKIVSVKKQANVIIIFVNSPDQTYRYALESKWVGGRKNDVIVLIGKTTPDKFDYVDTITLGSNAGNSLMTVLMRDRLMTLSQHDYKSVIDTISNTVLEKFDRRPMADYKSLEKKIKPITGIIPFTLIFELILSIGLTIFFHKNEVV